MNNDDCKYIWCDESTTDDSKEDLTSQHSEEIELTAIECDENQPCQEDCPFCQMEKK